VAGDAALKLVPWAMTVTELRTPRLRLRGWTEADKPLFAAMNQDPRVMEFFPALQSAEQSHAMADIWNAQLAEQGWSNWAVERTDTCTWIGFVGLTIPRRVLPFSPCVEIGWRLAHAHWGQGFASEAARCALQHGFDVVGLPEIVSFTALTNQRSRAVMERIGMHDAHAEFEHPAVPEDNPLRPHCLYRLTQSQWRAQQTTHKSDL
jgi:RimJ/RimL family protein N-acetyltransferase